MTAIVEKEASVQVESERLFLEGRRGQLGPLLRSCRKDAAEEDSSYLR